MCDEREQVIGYVYDECDGEERRRIEAHVATCQACRREIEDLRRVRGDLLAWDVPDRGSVWRPFTPARPKLTWRDVPTWTLAAAAGVILMAGAAGGAATAVLLAHGPANASVVATAEPGHLITTVTPKDLAALERRVMDETRSEMDDRVRVLAAHEPVTERASASDQDLEKQLKALRNDQLDFASAVNEDFSAVQHRVGLIERAYGPSPASWQTSSR